MPVAPEYLHLVYPDRQFAALLYGRNSHDPTGKGRSVADQLHEGRGLCDTHAWPIVGVFDKDVGKSASRHAKRRRDDFEALLEAIANREGNIVVAFEASRYYRDLEAYVRLRAACLEADVLLCYNGEVYDLSKRGDRKATARDAIDAEDEAEGIWARNARTARRLVAEGWPAGRTPYGYLRRYNPNTGELVDQVPHPVRAHYVREVFGRFLAGQTTYSIAKWLNSVPEAAHPSGKPWDADRVVIQLRLLAYAGRRVHKGVDAGKGVWDPLVTMDVFQAAQTLLDAPGRRTQTDTVVTYLQSGIATCGLHPEAESFLRHNKGRYSCKDRHDTVIAQPLMDAYVEEAVLRWWSSPEALAAFRRDEDTAKVDRARELLAGLEEQMRDARDLAATVDPVTRRPRLSVLSLADLETRLIPQIEQARQDSRAPLGIPPELAKLVGRPAVDEVWQALPAEARRQLAGGADPGTFWAGLTETERRRAVQYPDVEEVWAAMDLVEKRAALRASVRIRLMPAHVRGARHLRPGRILLAFRGDPDFRLYVPRRQTPT